MVRRPRLLRLRAPRLAALGRLHRRRVPEQARHRHLQFLERAEQLQPPPAHRRRSRQARRMGGRRLSPGISHHLPGRDVHAPHHHALSQPDGHGRGGIHPRQPTRWRGAAVRLRQDHPCAAHGRGQRGHPGHHGARRADARRPVARPAPRLRHRRPQALRPLPHRPPHRRRMVRNRRMHRAQRRPLHRDGHRFHHDQPCPAAPACPRPIRAASPWPR